MNFKLHLASFLNKNTSHYVALKQQDLVYLPKNENESLFCSQEVMRHSYRKIQTVPEAAVNAPST